MAIELLSLSLTDIFNTNFVSINIGFDLLYIILDNLPYVECQIHCNYKANNEREVQKGINGSQLAKMKT